MSARPSPPGIPPTYHSHKNRGVAVHLAVRLALEGKLDWMTVDTRIEGRIKAILKFLSDSKFTPIAIECRLASEIHQYAGCIDCVAEHECELTIIDWKSTFEPSAEVQLGLYENLWCINDSRSIRRGVIVECRDDGSYKCHWMTGRELKSAGQVGLAMLSIWSWLERNGLNKKD